jgi:hypothetical protein
LAFHRRHCLLPSLAERIDTGGRKVRRTPSREQRITCSWREAEVLAELAAGGSNRAVAQRLVLTRRAVEKHINPPRRGAMSSMTNLFGADQAHRFRRSNIRLLKVARTGAQDCGQVGARRGPHPLTCTIDMSLHGADRHDKPVGDVAVGQTDYD